MTTEKCGWPEEIFFVASVPSCFECGICYLAARDGRICPSGHLFCHGCLEIAITRKKSCPLCRIAIPSIDQTTVALPVRKFLQQRHVKCPNSHIVHESQPDISCVWTSTSDDDNLTALDRHLREECPWRETACVNGCPWKGLGHELAAHLVACGRRPIPCPYGGCGRQIPYDDMGRHQAICDYGPVECTYCHESYLRMCIDEHRNGECPERPVSCPHVAQLKINRYRIIKVPCDWSGPYRERQLHQTTCKHVMGPCPAGCGSTVALKYGNELEEHIMFFCTETSVPCPRDCGASIRRGDAESHERDDCPLTPMVCPFSPFACELGAVPRLELDAHLSDPIVNRRHAELSAPKPRLEDYVRFDNCSIASFGWEERKRKRVVELGPMADGRKWELRIRFEYWNSIKILLRQRDVQSYPTPPVTVHAVLTIVHSSKGSETFCTTQTFSAKSIYFEKFTLFHRTESASCGSVVLYFPLLPK